MISYNRGFKKYFFSALFLFMFSSSAFTQGRGIVKGRLTEAESGEPLLYANVAIEGTSIGTVTDDEGRYRISNLKPGNYTLVFSYLSYATQFHDMTIEAGQTTTVDGNMVMESIMGEEIIVTGMLRGQSAAINQQVKANTIVNVVSKEKISQLPDANAAEAIARLPGISIERNAGEGSKVVVRGLSPKFNAITINGERIPSTDPADRSVDLSMISADMLEGMEVFKSLTADKDADAVGGSVNFVVKDADPGFQGMARIQTGYNSHEKEFGQYKGVLSLGNRFFKNRFGLLVTGSLERTNRSSDLLDVSYDYRGTVNDTAIIGVNNMNLIDRIEQRSRQGVSLTADYKLNNGEIVLSSSFNQTTRDEVRRRKRYRLGSWYTEYDVRDREINTSLMSNTLTGSHDLGWLAVNWRTSYSASNRNLPFSYAGRFRELAPFYADIVEDKGPDYIPEGAKNSIDDTFMKESVYDQGEVFDRNMTVQVDLQAPFIFGDNISGYVKAGGKIRSKKRKRDDDRIWSSHFGINELAEDTLDQWELTDENKLKITNFFDTNCSIDPWLGGRYEFGPCLDPEKVTDFYHSFRDYTFPLTGNPLYIVEPWTDLNDYTAGEQISSAYIMSEINFGKVIMFLPGVRYEQTQNIYESVFGNPFTSEDDPVNIGNLTDTTGGQNYSELLPMIHLRIKPTNWFDIRLAYTHTLSRPDYYNLVPYRRVIRFDQEITQGNPGLKHTRATNYDAFLSVYNKLGLFTLGLFYKELDDIDYIRTSRLKEGEFAGYFLTEPVNAEGISTVKGFEVELQTNLRYLPSPLDGLVFYVNYSRMFSETFFPFLEIGPRSPDPPFRPTIIDTVRSGRMPGQVDYVANASVGYEKGGFSARVSLVLQGVKLEYIGSRPELDGYTDSYARWDLIISQQFRERYQVYLNVNNFTNLPERAFLGDIGYPTIEEYFGWTADLGFRYKF